jgi:hypothetical protein
MPVCTPLRPRFERSQTTTRALLPIRALVIAVCQRDRGREACARALRRVHGIDVENHRRNGDARCRVRPQRTAPASDFGLCFCAVYVNSHGGGETRFLCGFDSFRAHHSFLMIYATNARTEALLPLPTIIFRGKFKCGFQRLSTPAKPYRRATLKTQHVCGSQFLLKNGQVTIIVTI